MEMLTNPTRIDVFRLKVLLKMLELEIKGMKRSRSPSAYVMLKRSLILSGNRKSVLKQAKGVITQLDHEVAAGIYGGK
jgi:hypothetical protein